MGWTLSSSVCHEGTGECIPAEVWDAMTREEQRVAGAFGGDPLSDEQLDAMAEMRALGDELMRNPRAFFPQGIGGVPVITPEEYHAQRNAREDGA